MRFSIGDSQRILFLVYDEKLGFMGHLGLSNIDGPSCTLDNVMRGTSCPPGVMYKTVKVLLNWATLTLNKKTINLEVRSDNLKAIALYNNLGFEEVIRSSIYTPSKAGDRQNQSASGNYERIIMQSNLN